MLMIRQFPDLVSKLPGISAHTFRRGLLFFSKGTGQRGRFPSVCHANSTAWKERDFVLIITRLLERFEMHDLHSLKIKFSLFFSCTAAWALY